MNVAHIKLRPKSKSSIPGYWNQVRYLMRFSHSPAQDSEQFALKQ